MGMGQQIADMQREQQQFSPGGKEGRPSPGQPGIRPPYQPPKMMPRPGQDAMGGDSNSAAMVMPLLYQSSQPTPPIPPSSYDTDDFVSRSSGPPSSLSSVMGMGKGGQQQPQQQQPNSPYSGGFGGVPQNPYQQRQPYQPQYGAPQPQYRQQNPQYGSFQPPSSPYQQQQFNPYQQQQQFSPGGKGGRPSPGQPGIRPPYQPPNMMQQPGQVQGLSNYMQDLRTQSLYPSPRRGEAPFKPPWSGQQNQAPASPGGKGKGISGGPAPATSRPAPAAPAPITSPTQRVAVPRDATGAPHHVGYNGTIVAPDADGMVPAYMLNPSLTPPTTATTYDPVTQKMYNQATPTSAGGLNTSSTAYNPTSQTLPSATSPTTATLYDPAAQKFSPNPNYKDPAAEQPLAEILGVPAGYTPRYNEDGAVTHYSDEEGNRYRGTASDGDKEGGVIKALAKGGIASLRGNEIREIDIIKAYLGRAGVNPKQVVQLIEAAVKAGAKFTRSGNTMMSSKAISPDTAQIYFYTVDTRKDFNVAVHHFLGTLKKGGIRVVYLNKEDPDIIQAMKTAGADIRHSDIPGNKIMAGI